MAENKKICMRCKKPVVATGNYYDVQEKMHWLCFHLEFEHDDDPDKPCSDPNCPWLQIEILKEKLMSLSIEPDDVISEEFSERYGT